ncbi:MAG: PilZ domain-containing protein [Desulfobacterales bacterium]|nr:MAG: PilZ domain-containing protein [Desulfobacterales bacterium]
MASTKVRIERRKHKRFRVNSSAFVMLTPPDTCMGRIIDIGADGLAFEYVDGEDTPSRPNELEIIVTDSAFRLNHIPCEIIYDLTIYENPVASSNKKRFGVQFGKLTDYQRDQIQYFIRNHTTIEP